MICEGALKLDLDSWKMVAGFIWECISMNTFLSPDYLSARNWQGGFWLIRDTNPLQARWVMLMSVASFLQFSSSLASARISLSVQGRR